MTAPESSPQKFYSFTEEQLEFAYHLEGQAIAVRQAQECGGLIVNFKLYDGARLNYELGHRWVRIGSSNLFGGDCNMDFIWELDERGKTARYTEILGAVTRPDVFGGRLMHPVAALLAEERIIYLSPGFEAWKISFQTSVSPKLRKQGHTSSERRKLWQTKEGPLWPENKFKWSQLSRNERRRIIHQEFGQ